MLNQSYKSKVISDMSAIDAIYSRHAIRHYKDEIVDSELIDSLLDAAVQAPSAMHESPWAFVVIQDKSLLHAISEDVKRAILNKENHHSHTTQHGINLVSQKNYEIFYNANTLIVICSRFQGPFVQADCWLAAENLMIAACAKGLGTCVIGFAIEALNTNPWKERLGIPPEMTVVAPIIMGIPSGEPTPIYRKPPKVLAWRSLALESKKKKM